MRTREEIIQEYLEEVSDSTIVALWNECQIDTRYDAIIYENEECELEQQFSSVIEAIRQFAQNSLYSMCDSYFYYNGLGNIESFNSIYDVVEISELTDWALEQTSVNGDDVWDILRDAFIEDAIEDGYKGDDVWEFIETDEFDTGTNFEELVEALDTFIETK